MGFFDFGNRGIAARFVIPFLFVVCLVFFAVLSPLIKLLLWLLHSRRPLSARERSFLMGHPLAPSIRVVARPHALMRVFFGGAAACSIENTFFVFAEETPELSAALVRHEFVHTLQYREHGGFSLFLGQYFAFTLYDLMASRCDGRTAYKANPFEQDAKKAEPKRLFIARSGMS